MSEFDNREKAYEKQFELDQETQFKIASRTAKLFGQWAAQQLGLVNDAAHAYATQAVESVSDKTGHDALIARVLKDLQAKGVELTRHHLEREMDIFHRAAREQVGA